MTQFYTTTKIQYFLLTFSDHFPMRSSGARFGAGSGDILLDNLMCTGNEMTLLDCRSPLRVNNCNHSEDAGVICGSKSIWYEDYKLYVWCGKFT